MANSATASLSGSKTRSRSAYDTPYDIKLKIMIVGNSCVGKSSILMRYCSNTFQRTHIQTIGVDFQTKHLRVHGHGAMLQIWDTAGQERFRSITNTYYRGASGIMLVYDVTDRKSFDKVTEWATQIRARAGLDVVCMLIGNKTDVREQHTCESESSIEPSGIITTEMGRRAAEALSYDFAETSAKVGVGVEEAFARLAGMCIKKTSVEARKARSRSMQQPSSSRISTNGLGAKAQTVSLYPEFGGRKHCCGN
jgi:Ras-related protein Rab-8A